MDLWGLYSLGFVALAVLYVARESLGWEGALVLGLATSVGLFLCALAPSLGDRHSVDMRRPP